MDIGDRTAPLSWAEVLAVAVDSTADLQKMAEKIAKNGKTPSIVFLSDPGHRVIDRYGIWNPAGKGWPHPTTLVIDRQGIVRSATAARPTVGDRVTAVELEKAMKELDLIRPSREKLVDDFAVGKTDGGTFQLSEHRGKVVFINFWATWCPPCREEMPAMERLLQRSRKGDLVMLAVSVDTDPKVVVQFLNEQRFTFTVGLDPTMRLADTYGVRALPTSFIVDGRGRLAAFAFGPRRWDDGAAQALIEGMSR